MTRSGPLTVRNLIALTVVNLLEVDNIRLEKVSKVKQLN